MTAVDTLVSDVTGIPLADDDVPRLGIICRFDEGGLGAQTWEYARHLNPDHVLLVGVNPPRGEPRPDRYTHELAGCPKLWWASFPPGDGELEVWARFAEACDVVLSAETFYMRDFPTIAARAGTRLVLHANPELWEWGSHPGFDTWAPTPWMLGRLPGTTEVVPVPVDRERCAPRDVTEVRTILHVSAPAMLDRNGTETLKAALPYCQTSFRMLIAGPNQPPEKFTMSASGVTCEPIDRTDDYWRIYDDADALVLPRRYGGLCLPMQEAASCGLPVIATWEKPQKDWLAQGLGVRAQLAQRARMKGGMVNVWTSPPEMLAATIDLLVSGETLEAGKRASASYAQSIDWKHWEPEYQRRLRSAR